MNQRGFGIIQIILIIVGVIILAFAVFVGSLGLRYQRDLKLMEQKEKDYQIYKESHKSASPSAVIQ